jgi:hypothetical protein
MKGGEWMSGWKRIFLTMMATVLLTAVSGTGSAGFGERTGTKTDSPPMAGKRAQLAQVKGAFIESLEKGAGGRFQAVRLDGSSVFVLDTRDGHLWAWAFGKEGGFITYQGRVFPGLRMGDVIEASESAGKR